MNEDASLQLTEGTIRLESNSIASNQNIQVNQTDLDDSVGQPPNPTTNNQQINDETRRRTEEVRMQLATLINYVRNPPEFCGDPSFCKFMGYLCFTLCCLSTIQGYLVGCKQFWHHYFIVWWAVKFLADGAKVQANCGTFIIYIYLWTELLSGQPCHWALTVNIVFILLVHSEYLLALFVVFMGGMCCCACVFYVVINALRGRQPLQGIPDFFAERRNRALGSIKDKEIDPQSECSICFEKQMNCQLPCHHEFHRECITNWFQTRFNCPVCRQQA